MLKRLLHFLNEDLSGRTWEREATHPYFGDIVLFAFRDNDNSYWEAEIDHEGRRISVAINAPARQEPDDEHVRFCKQILADPDVAFGLAAPLLVGEYERWHKEPFPSNWRSAFSLAGLTVPASATSDGEWALTYESLNDLSKHHFTCHFSGGIPINVAVDG